MKCVKQQLDGTTEFHIGIDDTDSREGGCTTYTASILVQRLLDRGFQLADFPWLVRLNPNIPWKTRGNGALAVQVRVDERQIGEVTGLTLETVEETSDPSIRSTDPALVFFRGTIPREVKDFSSRALCDVIRPDQAEKLAVSMGAETHTLAGPRGLVGALAAIGAGLDQEHTYEIIAYRTPNHLGTPRRVDFESVRKMDAKYYGRTFNNLDPETGRVLICPHGPDPVLFGIRGEDPLSLLEGFQEVVVGEPIERVMLFKTNHGTDAHLCSERRVGLLRAHQSTVVTGRVGSLPRTVRGGHVIFKLEDETGSIDCAAYEPTGSLRKIALQLIPGDVVKAYGGVRRMPRGRLTLNLEKLEVLQLADKLHWEKPRCSKCGSSCEAMGREQGFRCRKCGLRFPRDSLRPVVMARQLKTTFYIAPPRAHRHLTKPLSRYRVEDPVGQLGREQWLGQDWSSLIIENGAGRDLANLLKSVQPASPV